MKKILTAFVFCMLGLSVYISFAQSGGSPAYDNNPPSYVWGGKWLNHQTSGTPPGYGSSGGVTEEMLESAKQEAVASASADAASKVKAVTDNIYRGNTELLDGGKLADKSVTKEKLADKSVTMEKIEDMSVSAGKLCNGAVGINQIRDGAVTSAKIRNGAVCDFHLANGSVFSLKLADKSVTPEKIADRAVTAGKLADKSVTSEKIAPNAVSHIWVLRHNYSNPSISGSIPAGQSLVFHTENLANDPGAIWLGVVVCSVEGAAEGSADVEFLVEGSQLYPSDKGKSRHRNLLFITNYNGGFPKLVFKAKNNMDTSAVVGMKMFIYKIKP